MTEAEDVERAAEPESEPSWRKVLAALAEIADSKYCDYQATASGSSYGTGVTDGHRYCANIARKALAEREAGGWTHVDRGLPDSDVSVLVVSHEGEA